MNRIKKEKIIRSILFIAYVSIFIFANKEINVMAGDIEEYTPEEYFDVNKENYSVYKEYYCGYDLYPGVTIEKINNINKDEYINIPETIDGEKVTCMNNVFFDENVKAIKLPNSISWYVTGMYNYDNDDDSRYDENDNLINSDLKYDEFETFKNSKNLESIIITENSELFNSGNKNTVNWEQCNPEMYKMDSMEKLCQFEMKLASNYYTDFDNGSGIYQKSKNYYEYLWDEIYYRKYNYYRKKTNLFVIKDKNGFTREGGYEYKDLKIDGVYSFLERGAGNFNEDDFDVIFEFVEGEDAIRLLKINNKMSINNFLDGDIYIDGKDYNVIFTEGAELLKPCVVATPLSDSMVKLYWEDVPYAKGYQLYKYYPTSKTFIKSKYVEKTSTRFYGLKPGKTYYYVVQAVGENITSGEPNKNQAIYVTTLTDEEIMPLDNLRITWRSMGKSSIDLDVDDDGDEDEVAAVYWYRANKIWIRWKSDKVNKESGREVMRIRKDGSTITRGMLEVSGTPNNYSYSMIPNIRGEDLSADVIRYYIIKCNLGRIPDFDEEEYKAYLNYKYFDEYQ